MSTIRLDANVGNSTTGTTNIGLGVNERPPSNQDPDLGVPTGAGGPSASGGGGTTTVSETLDVSDLDNRAPEYLGCSPSDQRDRRVLFGNEVPVKLYFAYSVDDPDHSGDPAAIFTYNPESFPPDLFPNMVQTQITFEELISADELGYLPGGVTYGAGRFVIRFELGGTLSEIDPQGGTYTGETFFSIGAICCTDFRGRSVYSNSIIFSGIPLSTIESNPPVITIYSPLNYASVGGTEVHISGKVEDSAGTNNGISELTVGGNNVEVPSGSMSVTFDVVVGELLPGCNAIEVTAKDNSLRYNEASVTVYVISGDDPTPPLLTVDTPPDETEVNTFSPTYEFSGTATDANLGNSGIAGVWVGGQLATDSVCDGADSVNWVCIYEGLTLGHNTIAITCEDYAGNQSSMNRYVNRNVDTTGPEINISSPTELEIDSYASSHTIQGSASDSGVGDNGIAFVTVGGVNMNVTATAEGSVDFERTVALVLGPNSYNVVAEDSLGNSTTVTIVITRIEP